MSGKVKTGVLPGARLLAFLLALALASLMVIACAQNALASQIYLKSSATVTDTTIKLGDIFGGLEKNSGKVLGAAPKPGAQMTINARTLLRVALALDLPWRPSDSKEHIVISRAANIVENELIKSAIAEKLVGETGLEGPFEVEFANYDNSIILPHDIMPGAEVKDISLSPKRDWFKATIAAPSSENPVRQRQITGAIKKIVEIPVLKSNLRNGDVINASDIDWLELYERDIQHDYLLEAEHLIGQTPRRMVMAGKPVREIELQAPRIVKRGETVTIIYEDGPLRLTAEGRAIRGGSRGDFIRVVNNSSSRTIDGIVAGKRLVKVK
jgi:flagella basal body P-ring formation protein FlgA